MSEEALRRRNGKVREVCHEERVGRVLQAVYTRETQERQTFMEDLKEIRQIKFKRIFAAAKKAVGPRWYHALSEVQRRSLDKLQAFIHQDILEAHPHRVAGVLNDLGLYPRPNETDLLCCVYAGRHDPKMLLAQLYHITFGYPIEAKQQSYCLNARLLLSAILYLGIDNLIILLRKRFKPDSYGISSPPPKPKPKLEPSVRSPYLEKLVAFLYEKPKYQRPPPPPLPKLDELNQPYEPIRIAPKPPPPPPPPPPPKKRLPKSYCDKLAGIQPVGLYTESNINLIMGQSPSAASKGKHKLSPLEIKSEKKRYGVNLPPRKNKNRKRLKHPTTGSKNTQYTINGVAVVNGKSYLILGNVTILPPQGDIIHGGSAYLDGTVINIHCGHRGFKPPELALRCDCVKKWQESVFNYLHDTKCKCGHNYDYKNEGSVSREEFPYFVKPTPHTPAYFDYPHIFNLDRANSHVEKEFTKLWEADSLLFDGTGKPKDEKRRKKKKTSSTSNMCLGKNPTPSDYLKCALRFMREQNLAARLPDLHLVPELKEWMRYRMHGPLTATEKLEFNRKSSWFWGMFVALANKGFGHVDPPANPLFTGCSTDWARKPTLNKKFKMFIQEYRLAMFRSYAHINNMFWRTMYQAEFPDKKFREIFFSYLFSCLKDITLMCPYSSKFARDRMVTMARKRCICLPPEVEKLM